MKQAVVKVSMLEPYRSEFLVIANTERIQVVSDSGTRVFFGNKVSFGVLGVPYTVVVKEIGEDLSVMIRNEFEEDKSVFDITIEEGMETKLVS